MDTPIAAVLWHDREHRDVQSLLRLLEHVEMACMELGNEAAAALLAEAQAELAVQAGQRRLAA
ncbi:soj family protein [Acetobacteraceae bacterium H6797]|nr:soj family protein [Acetobacteraceae bacterium H6797]